MVKDSAPKIELIFEKLVEIDFQPLQRAIKSLNQAGFEWLKPGTIGLRLVDDGAIRALNKEYAGLGEVTDVLSFNYQETGEHSPETAPQLGDIVISRQTAAIQAKAAGNTLGDELALLGLHGVLHILGHDHATPRDQNQLDELQKSLLTKAKVKYRKFEWKD